MIEGFYRAFEDEHRGSRELILGRLKAYAPLLKIIKSTFPGGDALDLGCGRGEWLELLGSLGIHAKGVDLDSGMLDACRERGYQVEEVDAIRYLQGLPSESLVLISAFHLVEHIPFEMLTALVAEAFRVLEPGGVLIMETPNPENLCVGTESFYLDPSHVKPIPPRLLSFIPEFIGFERTTIFRLQEPMSLFYQDSITLLDVFTGVSPDYAVIAQKKAGPATTVAFDQIFAAKTGLTLEQIARRFEGRLHSSEVRIRSIEAEQVQIAAEFNQKLDMLGNELLSVYNSRSWRITKPLRDAISFLRAHGVNKQLLNPKRLMAALVGMINRLPWVKKILGLMLKPFPRLRLKLKQSSARMQRGESWSDKPRKKAIVYNMAASSVSDVVPVDEIIQRINIELGAGK